MRCWYAYSWYPPGWEIGYDFRSWAIGFWIRNGSFGVHLGPAFFCNEDLPF